MSFNLEDSPALLQRELGPGKVVKLTIDVLGDDV
jgi:hypothetical protein